MNAIPESVRAKFRAAKNGRYRLAESCVMNGVRYSADGRILLCEPTTDPDSDRDLIKMWPNPRHVLEAVGLPDTANVGPWSSERLPGPIEEPWQPHLANLLVKAAPDWFVESIISWTIDQLPGMQWRVVPSGELKAILFKAAGGAYGFTHAVNPSPYFQDSDFWKMEGAK